MAELLVQDTTLAAIADAIRGKTEGTEALAFPNGFIEAIASIGGLPDGISAMETGEYTPSTTSTSSVQLEHSLGVAPNFVFVIKKGATIDNSELSVFVLTVVGIGSTTSYHQTLYSTGNNTSSGKLFAYQRPTETTFYAKIDTNSKMIAGNTYFWLVAVVDGVS